MNEFTAKKIGEVIAFSRVGLLLTERGETAFLEALDEKIAIQFREEMKGMQDWAEQYATEVSFEKAEKTTKKLQTMMEQYIGDEWDNPVELLEWLSFFAGAGAAHWALVAAAAEASGELELAAHAVESKSHYYVYLEIVIERLATIGSARAQ